jgi:hypothetical protein
MNNKMIIKIANESLELYFNRESLSVINMVLPVNLGLDFNKFIQLTA